MKYRAVVFTPSGEKELVLSWRNMPDPMTEKEIQEFFSDYVVDAGYQPLDKVAELYRFKPGFSTEYRYWKTLCAMDITPIPYPDDYDE